MLATSILAAIHLWLLVALQSGNWLGLLLFLGHPSLIIQLIGFYNIWIITLFALPFCAWYFSDRPARGLIAIPIVGGLAGFVAALISKYGFVICSPTSTDAIRYINGVAAGILAGLLYAYLLGSKEHDDNFGSYGIASSILPGILIPIVFLSSPILVAKLSI